MAYLQVTAPSWNVWRLPGRTSRRDRVPEKLIASSRDDYNADYSPDGRKIAFDSNRSGANNIWVCDADGSHPIQLTSFASYTGTPRWSPDGRRIVFDSVEAGDWNLYVIEADGGIPRRLTQESSDDSRGDWSGDGRWLYFASHRSGHPQIWRMPAEGGQAVQVTHGGAVSAEASWDDRQLYFVGKKEDAIWRVPLPAGQETEVLSGPRSYYAMWALSRSGIYHATEQARAFAGVDVSRRTRVATEYAIRFLDFESGEVTELFRKEGPFRHRWLAVSPDEEWILYGEQPLAQAELMLVENFR
jgi:Tol biopolymer transport system component